MFGYTKRDPQHIYSNKAHKAQRETAKQILPWKTSWPSIIWLPKNEYVSHQGFCSKVR